MSAANQEMSDNESEMTLLDYDRLLARDRSFYFTSSDLLIGIALLAVVLGAYVTFGLLGAAPAMFAVSVAFIYLGHRRQRRLARWVGRLLMAPALLALFLAFVAYAVFGVGPRFNRAKWPLEIREIASIGGADLDGARVTCHADFLDDEFVWRQPLPSNGVDAVCRQYASTRLSPNEVPDWFIHKFPLWWRPSPTANCQYFANGTAREGFGGDWEEGRIMLYDRDAQQLYVWQYREF